MAVFKFRLAQNKSFQYHPPSSVAYRTDMPLFQVLHSLFVIRHSIMSRLPLIIGPLLVGTILSGCASSPWSAGKNNDRTSASPVSDKSTAATATPSKANGQNPQGASVNSQANAQAMQEIMEELRQLGTLDPAAQNKLMEDLKQTDPALWPLVMQQFRAAIAYKRRAAQREAMAANGDRKSVV